MPSPETNKTSLGPDLRKPLEYSPLSGRLPEAPSLGGTEAPTKEPATKPAPAKPASPPREEPKPTTPFAPPDPGKKSPAPKPNCDPLRPGRVCQHPGTGV